MTLGVLGCLLVLSAGPGALELRCAGLGSPGSTGGSPVAPPFGRRSETADRAQTPDFAGGPLLAGTSPSGARLALRRSRDSGRGRLADPAPDSADRSRPEQVVRIGLQAGHWRADEAPRELSGLRRNGTRWGDLKEWQVNLEVALRAQAMLEEVGYEVDLLPAVVPPGYRAHLFISIHADGSEDPRASGYRVASSRRDQTGQAARFAALLGERYGEVTGLRRLPSATRRMRNYYAFNYRRYVHALHPMTIGVILEAGFLTNGSDRRIIVDDPGRVARGIVEAVLAFPETRLQGASERSN